MRRDLEAIVEVRGAMKLNKNFYGTYNACELCSGNSYGTSSWEGGSFIKI
jgi:hypothetical protein